MKPIAFLRNALRKKGKKKSSKAPSSVEPFLLEVPPASPLLKSSFTEATPVLSPGFEHPLKDTQVPITDRPTINEAENWEIFSPHIDPNLRGKHGSLFLLESRGLPQNASSAVLDLGGKSFRNKFHPQHPDRPPLYLSSRPPSPVLRSPTHVKFAPEPQIRTAHPSSLPQTFRRIGVQNQASVSSAINEIPNQENYDFEEIDTSTANSTISSRNISAPHPLSDSASTAHVDSDFPSSPTMKTSVRASSSSPHLQTRLETESQSHEENLNSSQDTLASFPHPPPLKVKRKPHPLVLLPTPTTARLPPSPLASSTDSTPLVTPLSSPRSSRFSGRPLHTVTPPRYSPPNSPLPTPPTSSAFLAPSDHKILPRAGKIRRTAHSTSELRDHWFEVTYPVHRSTSSTPSSDVFASDNASRWHKEFTSAKSDFLETMQMPDPPYEHGFETQIHWGYAL